MFNDFYFSNVADSYPVILKYLKHRQVGMWRASRQLLRAGLPVGSSRPPGKWAMEGG